MCWFATLGTALGASEAAATAVGAMATMSAASSALSVYGQHQQARTQQKYQNLAVSQEAARFMREQSAMRREQAQREQSAAEESLAIQLRAQRAAATATTAAGEAGVSGSSVDDLINSYFQQEGDYRRALTMEQGFQKEATGTALLEGGFRTQMETTRIRRPINAPSLVEGVVNIGASLYQGADAGFRYQRAREGT